MMNVERTNDEQRGVVYTDTLTKRYRGNPFIEALPPLPQRKIDFSVLISDSPPAPTNKDRKSGEIVRLIELATLNDVVYPFAGYADAALAASTMLREAYRARNPINPLDVKRRHAQAVSTSESGIYVPSEWESSGQSHLIVANSGIGKSTFVDRFLRGYPRVIQHTSYQGKPLQHAQLVYLKLRVPNDGSLKGLCYQFFHEIDRHLGTKYLKQARAAGTISTMTLLMQQVVTATSLGLVVIDEFQNLRSAAGRQAEHVKNLIGELIEWTGVSVLIISTPAIDQVIEGNLGNARKMTTTGQSFIGSMQRGSATWAQFCETLWDYTYVQKKGILSEAVLNAWYDASAGNTAFAKLAFILAQRKEIGGRECVDVSSFEFVANNDLLFLRPAIRALLSNKASALVDFNDLFISRKYKELRAMVGMVDEAVKTFKNTSEFEEMREQKKEKKAKPMKNKKTAPEEDCELPEEDPLLIEK
ncbi:ATP-binding protein [Herbaspirillum chlorophenolicum]|uniref:ATP-binding protein n=1 Tax=Herbaspirillum chlorophenolicum TaxID=211589 RepID=UPI000A573F10|nr:ATP-binding protein [Herbaspirillum chlorophenolicum]